MAIYHLNVKTGSRKGGQSARAKSDYIQREGSYGRDKKEVMATHSENFPDWAKNARAYWDSADLYERSNGRLYKEVEFSLPVELSLEKQRDLAIEFARMLTAKERLPFTLALHRGKGHNPHCHLMISERMNDGVKRSPEQWFKRFNRKHPEKGGAQKSESLKPKEWLHETRETWALHANRVLEKGGHKARLDHRTLEAQGVERLPGVHVGPNVVEMEERGITTKRGERALAVARANEKILDLREYEGHLEHGYIGQTEKIPGGDGSRHADRALSPEHGQAFGRSSAQPQGHGKGQRRPGEDLGAKPAAGHGDVAGDYPGCSQHVGGAQEYGPNGAKEQRKDGPGLDFKAVARLLNDVRRFYADAYDRIVALASPAGHHNERGKDVAHAQASLASDRTVQAIRRQLKAMGCERFEVGVRDVTSGKMMNREMTPQEIEKSTPWLKRLNARGNDIYVRPAKGESHGFVLVDDLKASALGEMKARGFGPSVVVETSPQNYQAWVKSSEALGAEERTLVARGLAKKYGADKASADGHHYGRLAGFTNRKKQHEGRDGKQPWVLCRESHGKAMERGPEVVAWVKKQIKSIQLQEEQQKRMHRISQAKDPTSYSRGVVEEFCSEMKGLMKHYGDDLSRCDFIASMNLAKKGRQAKDIAYALKEASPNLSERKAGHMDDYVQRTISKVMELPQVQQKQAQLLQQHEIGLSR